MNLPEFTAWCQMAPGVCVLEDNWEEKVLSAEEELSVVMVRLFSQGAGAAHICIDYYPAGGHYLDAGARYTLTENDCDIAVDYINKLLEYENSDHSEKTYNQIFGSDHRLDAKPVMHYDSCG